MQKKKFSIIKLKNNINILENLNNPNNEKGGLQKFVNDEKAIGKWTTILGNLMVQKLYLHQRKKKSIRNQR